MRQIATLPDEAAQKLADYLLTLNIETQLQQEDDGTTVWVRDEDRVPQARQELETFQRNPSDTRYSEAAATAHRLRMQEADTELEYRQKQKRAREQMADAGSPGPRNVTLAVVVVTILVTTSTQMAKVDVPLTEDLVISTRPAEWPRLSQVAAGEVWRLITPIFLHFDLLHIVFNLLMFLTLAGQIESQRGSGRLLLLILVLAIAGNLTQYYLVRPNLYELRIGMSRFGGLSGVVYGLFGYVWVKSRLQPDLGLQMSQQTVVILLGWFFLCLFFLQGVANGAHAGGLVAGVLLAAIPVRRQE
jgi:GlpG protein